MAAKAKVNRSELIRKILSDIGAISKDAPEGWAKTVTTKLEAKGIKVSPPMIYQIRTKQLSKAGLKVKAKRGRKRGRKATAVASVAVAAAPKASKGGNYSALFAVKKLANELGGLDEIVSAVQVLKQLG